MFSDNLVYITPLLKSLQWLPTSFKVKTKFLANWPLSSSLAFFQQGSALSLLPVFQASFLYFKHTRLATF